MSVAALPSLESLHRRSAKRTRDIFASESGDLLQEDESSSRVRLAIKIRDEYRDYKELPPALLSQQGPVGPSRPGGPARKMITAGETNDTRIIATIDKIPVSQPSTFSSNTNLSQALALHKTTRTVKPTYHPPWKLVRVISGHLGWVRSVAVEPGNKWFATGAGDRVVKIWDLASGELKLSLTGHISTMVKCWDLESNKVIRHYHGHLSGVYALSLPVPSRRPSCPVPRHSLETSLPPCYHHRRHRCCHPPSAAIVLSPHHIAELLAAICIDDGTGGAADDEDFKIAIYGVQWLNVSVSRPYFLGPSSPLIARKRR
ncbi:hypothetical protein NLJ89_g9386 [Agrocybe chaxingu]|uniref:Pre-mRNA-splicing factor PRP46 n=1 Tax=Agrocybe chaxingu TaxID=84603 RepID=A0A9W8MPX2_9AGAR|nr:hypothetical protein NLJ89_g9386 [Agrocybe chaxingu]